MKKAGCAETWAGFLLTRVVPSDPLVPSKLAWYEPAMAAPDVRVSQYVEGLRARLESRREEEQARRERLRAALPLAVERLVREFGVRRVVVFGSLARDEAGLESDVDLLVEGLPPERLFEASAALSRDLDSEVDLVPAEAARPEVLRRALEEGQLLHG